MKNRKLVIGGAALFLALTLSAPVTGLCGEAEYSQAASADEQVSNTQTVGKYGMLPIYGRDIKDGTYDIEAESTSSMFRIVKASLLVKNQEMKAEITLSGTGYLKLFMGTAQEAAEAKEEEYIGFEEDADGMYTYTIPVEALDKELDCAAYSKRKEQWYDRVILFDASSLPADALLVELPDYERIEKALEAYDGATDDNVVSGIDENEDAEAGVSQAEAAAGEDFAAAVAEDDTADDAASGDVASAAPVSLEMEDGEYAIEVTLTGGSGKASVNSPTYLIVKDKKAYARLQWSSSNYDYMLVGGEKYLNEADEGGYSVFTIPITAMDEEMPVIADTTAMGDPHEVEYSLMFYEESIGSKSRMPQEAAKRVVAIAMVIIIGGGILNHFINKKKRV